MILTQLYTDHGVVIFLIVATGLAAAIQVAVASQVPTRIEGRIWTAIAPRLLRMAPMKKRHEFYLEGEVSERLATLAAKPGASKTAIMTDALKAYLDRRAANALDERFKARLDELSVQLAPIARDQQIVAESLALLVRFQFMVTAPLPDSDRAARALAHERFKAFVEQVSRRISRVAISLKTSLRWQVLRRPSSDSDTAISGIRIVVPVLRSWSNRRDPRAPDQDLTHIAAGRIRTRHKFENRKIRWMLRVAHALSGTSRRGDQEVRSRLATTLDDAKHGC
jgi:hypothetical protein